MNLLELVRVFLTVDCARWLYVFSLVVFPPKVNLRDRDPWDAKTTNPLTGSFGILVCGVSGYPRAWYRSVS